MSTPGNNVNDASLPPGYAAIAISENQKDAFLKICVLVRSEPDPAGGHLVVLRDTIDARVFLGCTVDASGRLQDWLEIWVQNPEGPARSPAASRLSLSNAALDRRWHRQCRAFEKLDSAALIKTGCESTHPRPTFLNISARCPVHPAEGDTGNPWMLCTDDGLLAQKGLAPYGGTLHRYLYLPARGADSPFVPVTAGAPTNDSTIPLSQICATDQNLIPLNSHAALMFVRKHAPIGLETFVDILNGAAWDGVRHGRAVLELGERLKPLNKNEPVFGTEGRLFLESHGRPGRVVETFHLKLRLLADILSSVQRATEQLQRPLLNLRPESWQVRLGEPGHGLPFLWMASPVLGDPGDTLRMDISGSDMQYFLPSPAEGTSVYRPLVTSLPTKGTASVRIRRVLSEAGGTTVVEGTFSTAERIETAAHDLVWLKLNLACGQVGLYAHLETDSAMAAGEWRFRTVARNMPENRAAAVSAAEGVPMTDVTFEVLPLLSSPCDLYSLAVLAIRILLVDNTNNLPEVLDETLSLARQTGQVDDANVALEKRIADVFAADKRWVESLGPQHLTFDPMNAEEAFALVPSELWWATLAIVVRMFPGASVESACRDFGDARPGGLHRVFERAIADMDKLILRTRSLVLADWRSNAEIVSVIEKYLT